MKKLLSLFIVLVLAVTVFTSCDVLGSLLDTIPGGDIIGGNTDTGNGGNTDTGNGGNTDTGNGGNTDTGNGGNTDTGNGGNTDTGNGGNTDTGNGGNTDTGNGGNTDTGNGGNTDTGNGGNTDTGNGGNTDTGNGGNTDTGNGGNTDTGNGGNTDTGNGGNTDTGNGGNTVNHTYIDFTSSEKNAMRTFFGELIPFIANDEYYIDYFSDESGTGFNFYTYGNTESEFEEYLVRFAVYDSDGTEIDEYGDTWYFYLHGEYYIDISYYYCIEEGYEGQIVDVYVYTEATTDDGTGGDGEYLYTDFTSAEKSLLISYFGEVIPFAANDEYYLEEYTYEDETGLNFYTFNNTYADFSAYRELFSAYTYDGSYEDEYGDAWYMYSKGDYYVDLSYYDTDDGYVIDVYIYVLSDEWNGGNSGTGGSGDTENTDIITNDGAGLPTGSDGVYNADLTDATIVKDVTDQGYYLDGCPTVGTPGVLVIPVDFSDKTAASMNYDISVITNAFAKDGVTDYHSVYDYYYISSYGKLELDITVLDFWFRPSNKSTYYENATEIQDGEAVDIGDQLILDEALRYLESIMDLSEFDSDNNGFIDAVVLINTLDVGDDDFHWAYRYWNTYTDDYEDYYEYDGVSANDFMWASYQFLNEGYDEDGNVSYEYTNAVNTYTYIHEFGHILGADDYYDTAGVNDPMAGHDIMDGMLGDHNAFTKFNLGWLTSTRLVTTDSTVTLTLEDFSKNGDTIIVANNWDPSLGAYQEYFIVVYYKATGLNSGDAGYFARDGVIVYHVNSSLYREEFDGEVYYDVYNNNTDYSDEYGTKDNLIEFVLTESNTYTYIEGDSLPAAELDNGDMLDYTFTVDSLDGDIATLTFSRAA